MIPIKGGSRLWLREKGIKLSGFIWQQSHVSRYMHVCMCQTCLSPTRLLAEFVLYTQTYGLHVVLAFSSFLQDRTYPGVGLLAHLETGLSY